MTAINKFYDNRNNLLESFNVPAIKKNYAIIKKEDYYILCAIDQTKIYQEIKFFKTAILNVFLYDHYFLKTQTYTKSNAILTGNSLLEYSYEVPPAHRKKLGDPDYKNNTLYMDMKLMKIYPIEEESKTVCSATGFAISQNGIIVTNYHVIENATKIKVKGIKGDFSKSYSAKVIVSDKNNDLAILKIDDYSFTTLGTIPYMINNNSANVGENIFVLGYPLTATMGEEIKLTNGIISSKSGFQGDITSYQMTAPIQPGNSGAPMFDKDGNIVGIVNAKHVGVENAGYAVKTSYLFNLIDALPTTLKLPSVNTLKGKTLSSQVELANKFVYIIEVN